MNEPRQQSTIYPRDVKVVKSRGGLEWKAPTMQADVRALC